MTKAEPPEAGDYRKLFIIGCPRSGTTWVQLLLSQIPDIATAPETQIFAYYLVHFEKQWRLERQDSQAPQGRAGLSRVLSEQEFLDLCRQAARRVLDKIHARLPQASVVVEKSPKHALHAGFIRTIFTDAYFLHVLRDPRDTAASLLAASRSWADSWAPRNAVQAARMWLQHVESARQVADDTDHYREVPYERIKANPVTELQQILEWLRVPVTREICERAVTACDFRALQNVTTADALPLPGSRSPNGFFRRGEAGAWKTELSRSDVRTIEHICSRLMAELGYEPTLGSARRRPVRVRLHDAIQRMRESIDWQLARVLMRI